MYMDPQDPTSQAIAGINRSVCTEEVAASLTNSIQNSVDASNLLGDPGRLANRPILEALPRSYPSSTTERCPLEHSQPTNNWSQRFINAPLEVSQQLGAIYTLQNASITHGSHSQQATALQTAALLYRQFLNQQTQVATTLVTSSTGPHMNLSQPPLNQQEVRSIQSVEALQNLMRLLIAFYQAQMNNSNG